MKVEATVTVVMPVVEAARLRDMILRGDNMYQTGDNPLAELVKQLIQQMGAPPERLVLKKEPTPAFAREERMTRLWTHDGIR